ncbi:MAG TPA: bifunctional folylpolyglutamate synthase/dihydrofolate synthase [Lachnospiraceae bacterium]|uniref:bifunctional folylpolyglutamate synthase/dihydrofolate synthase n=1 Tax=Muricomes intestini TaxID=1796634 RepID=UPI000E7FCCEF|nr:bifunctional folylpolyglutamate synthase/dihydrofolate synthase [Lachnospiraceae bacterium]HCR84623.1 bifunctional folylpolyglutamate synthase/dihydrofolate synthase [Lachnospiraceae bacterium]
MKCVALGPWYHHNIIRKETGNVTYKEARVYLDEVSKYGSVLGLDTIRGLLNELDNPQDDLKFIHIAGTNGKGSVLAYTSTILSEAGYRTGRYVSPTVVSYLERIQVDGKWIPEDDFAELVKEVQKAIVRMEAHGEASPTVFEAETAVAFLYFKRMQCDFVVLETGLGGTLDATNVVKNTIAAVFSSVSRDHMEFLGESLKEIAGNKAGIMKPGCVVVTAGQKPEVLEVFEQCAGELGCRIYKADAGKVEILEESWSGQHFTYKNRTDIHISMAGRYQIVNAVTVLELIDALQDAGYRIPEESLRKGFEKTVWPGRFTCISTNPIFIVDGAHNEEAALCLRESVETYFSGKRLIFIMGVFQDKEYEKIAQIMGPMASKIFTVDLPDTDRTLKAAELAGALSLYCPDVKAETAISEAVKDAFLAAAAGDVILTFGSLSYLGLVMELVKKRGEQK